MQTASSLVQWAHTLWKKTSIQRIIGERCRCAGCRAPRPEKRIWCVSNGKWRWVILTLLAIMIFLLGKATQPGEGDGRNVSVHTNVRMTFGLSCHASASVMWFSMYSCSPDTNLVMLISARHHLVHVYPPFPKSASSSSYIETCHENACKYTLTSECVCQLTKS